MFPFRSKQPTFTIQNRMAGNRLDLLALSAQRSFPPIWIEKNDQSPTGHSCPKLQSVFTFRKSAIQQQGSQKVTELSAMKNPISHQLSPMDPNRPRPCSHTSPGVSAEPEHIFQMICWFVDYIHKTYGILHYPTIYGCPHIDHTGIG